METFSVPNIDLQNDPLLNTRDGAALEGISIPTFKRRVKAGDIPPPDLVYGQRPYWKRSTILIAREKRIAKCTALNEEIRAAQLANAARARAGRDRVREGRAAAERAAAPPPTEQPLT